MSYKSVCTKCKKSFAQGNDFIKSVSKICPHCGNEMFFVNEKFKPPKNTANKEWEIVEALLKGGYNFESFYQQVYPKGELISFPKKINEVEEYLQAYKNRM